MIPTIILSLPVVGDLYEAGRLAELDKPITDPSRPVNQDVSATDAIITGAAIKGREIIAEAKRDSFKAGLVVVGVGLAGYWIYKKVRK